MTANVLPAQIAAFREAGLDDHLGKPFTPADLQAVIARWMPDAAASAAPDRAEAPEETIARDCYEATLGLLPPQSVAQLLKHLGTLAAQSFSGSPETPEGRETLRREAHALTSASGLIGFSRLSAACAALDGYGEPRVGAEGRAGFEAALAQVRALTVLAARETRRLIADMEAPPGATAGVGR